MMPMKRGALAQAADEPPEPTLPGDPTTPDDSPEHEGAEAPDFETQEGVAEGGEDQEAGPEAGSPDAESAPEDQAEGGKEEAYTPQEKELFDLVVARTLSALSANAKDLDTALKADPIRAAVMLGTSALRTVAKGAEDAGKPVPFEILVQAGMQVIKHLGDIANQKGYLPDDQIDVFLKEAFQQSLSQYAKMDIKDGEMKPEDLQKLSKFANPMEKGAAAAGAVDQAKGALPAAAQEPMQ